MAERFIAPVLKTGNGASRSCVRIPPPPPFYRDFVESEALSHYPAPCPLPHVGAGLVPHDHPRPSGAREPRMGRPAGAQPAALPAGAARGSAQGEDKDPPTFRSRTAVRRLGCRGEDKDPLSSLAVPTRGGSRGCGASGACGGRGAPSPPSRRPRRAISAFSPPVDPQAERASGRKGMVMRSFAGIVNTMVYKTCRI